MRSTLQLTSFVEPVTETLETTDDDDLVEEIEEQGNELISIVEEEVGEFEDDIDDIEGRVDRNSDRISHTVENVVALIEIVVELD